MTRWQELRDAIEKTRGDRKKDWQNALIKEIKRAVGLKICAQYEPYRIKKNGRIIELEARGGMTMRAKKAEVPAIALLGLEAVEDAKMAFRVTLEADEKRVQQYVVSAEAKERSSGRPWYVRVDLDAEQKGAGPCGHAMLHAHVGVDPMEKGGQESRVPLPWLDPDEAVAWVLATLHQRLEPV